MDILGVGVPELIVIFLIAIMVFGPRRLPEVARQVGRYMAQLQKMSYQIRAEWQDQLSDVQEIKEEAAELSKVLPPSPAKISADIKSHVQNTISMTKPSATSQKIATPNNPNLSKKEEIVDE